MKFSFRTLALSISRSRSLLIQLLAACFAFMPVAARAQSVTLDTSFNSPVNDVVLSMLVQPDQKILIGGYFSLGTHIANARLNANGMLDDAFTVPTDWNAETFALQDDKVLIGGYFPNIPGGHEGMARLSGVNGSLDPTFTTSFPGGQVAVIRVLANGQILVGGIFSTVTASNGSFTRNGIVLLNPDGAVDTAFNANLGGPNIFVRAIEVQPNGQFVVGGSFSTVGVPAEPRSGMARLNPASGAPDLTFTANITGASNYVKSLLIKSNGNILIGGSFNEVNLTSRRSLAEVGPTGVLTSFEPITAESIYGNYVQSLVRQPDGKILVGGTFTNFLGATRNNMARINADQTLDPGFNPNVTLDNSGVEVIALQANGQILLGGGFSHVLGQSRPYLARLNEPEIGVEQPVGTPLTDGTSEVDFGSSAILVPVTRDFKIINTGSSNLVIQSATTTGDFSTPVIASPITVAPGSFTTLTVNFTPTVGGVRTGTLQITSNDGDESPFDINLAGNQNTSAPEIDIEQPVGAHLTDAGGTVNFGAAELLTPVTRTFTVTNTGNAPLTLTAPAPSGDFTPGTFGDASLDPTESTTLTVTFTPSAAGVRTGALHITSNDADESPFDIALTGTGFNAVGNAIFAWGDGINGGIGDGTTAGRQTPSPTTMTGVLANKVVISVVAGLTQSFALTADNQLFSWGLNSFGELGDGTTTFRKEPVAVDMTGISGQVSAFAVGSHYALALTSEGKVYSWGKNDFGQLGLGNTIARSTPQLVQGLLAGKNVVAISAGGYHTMALTSEGEVYGWGANGTGLLCDGTTINRLTPVALVKTGTLLAGKTIKSILCCSNRTVVLDSDGHLYSWGFNGNGQLGDGTTIDRILPVAVNGGLAGKKVVAVCGSVYSTHLALTEDNLLFSWGSNLSGVLGDGTTVNDRYAPVAVVMNGALLGKGIASIHGSGAGMMVKTTDNQLFTWGWPTGRPGGASSNVPVAVDVTGALAGRTVISASMEGLHALVIAYASPAPEITAKRSDNTELTDGAGTLDLTTALPLTSTTHTVTIKNDGNAVLSGLVVTRSGTHQAEFAFGPLDSTSLLPGATTTFTVTFTPAASGAREAALQIASNDANENSFDIALIGTGGIPITDWRQTYFSTTANTGDAADSYDFDHDGVSNLLEFATGGDPTDASVAETPVTPPADGFIQFSYTRNKQAMAELTYQLEWTDDLVIAWSGAGVTETIVSDNGVIQQVTATLPAGSVGNRFVHLKVVRP